MCEYAGECPSYHTVILVFDISDISDCQQIVTGIKKVLIFVFASRPLFSPPMQLLH